MNPNRYRKRPVVIEAIQLTTENVFEVAKWCSAAINQPGNPGFSGSAITITTLEGNMIAENGDFVIKGLAGEFYPCKASIFTKSYEQVI